MADQKMLELLQEKKEYLFEILRMTNDTVLDGIDLDEDAETYITLMDDREELISKLKELDEEMKQLTGSSAPPVPSSGSELKLYREIQDMAMQIRKRDEEINQKMPDILAHIQGEIKKMNRGKSMQQAYGQERMYNGGNYFDSKN